MRPARDPPKAIPARQWKRQNRVWLALAVAVAAALVYLVAKQTVRNYPAPDGFVLENGELLGGDFIAFYVGGRLFREDRQGLYDLEYQREYRDRLLGASAEARTGQLPFVYPPLVAALVSPFSRLPFQRAFAAWTLLGLLLSAFSLVLVARASGASAVVPVPLILLFSFAFLPYSMNALAGGQIAWLGMVLLAVLTAALLDGRDGLAGGIMSLSYYKPPLFLLLLIVLCLARGRRLVLGFVGGAAILTAATVALLGPGGLAEYIGTVSRYTYGQELLEGVTLPPSEGMGLVALLVTWTSSMEATLAILALPFLVIVGVGRRLLRPGRRGETLLGLVLSMTATVGLSLQCIKYDLALLLLPMILAVAYLGREPNRLGFAALLPLSGFYFEFAFRGFEIGGRVFNGASYLFLVVLGALTWHAWQSISPRWDDHGRSASSTRGKPKKTHYLSARLRP